MKPEQEQQISVMIDSLVNSASAMGYFEHDPVFVNEVRQAKADLLRWIDDQLEGLRDHLEECHSWDMYTASEYQ